MIKKAIYIFFLIIVQIGYGQNNDVLHFSEYLGYVKKYHPIVKQANLIISEGEAKLLKARGLFDPKLELDYNRKKFKNTNYYDKLNATFKIPTWYGIELKGKFEKNSGEFVNQENILPINGLYNLGVSVPLAKGLLINKRMATLKQAKLFRKQSSAENQILINNIIYEASKSYFHWLKTFQEKTVSKEFLDNAKMRLDGIKKSYLYGEKPAIDTIEAGIVYNNRKLNFEKNKLNYIKAKLELSNYLWIDNVPVELKNKIIPNAELIDTIDETLQINQSTTDFELLKHPKLKSLEYKYKSLKVERNLKKNNLLPQIDLEYNFLNETPKSINTFSTNNYKTGLNIRFPLFLRKERAEINLTNNKLQSINFDKQILLLSLKNKINSTNEEIFSYENQISILKNMVNDYEILLRGEERKFEIGESSLFLINARESKLIESKLKLVDLKNFLLNSKGKLFNILAVNNLKF